jgi:hypothetical protein
MNKETISALTEIPAWFSILLSVNVLLIFLIVYSKQIKSFLSDFFTKSSDGMKNSSSSKHLMDEVAELKQLNRDLAHRIQELEIIISKNQEMLEIIDNIQTDPNKVYIQGIGATITIARNLRLDKTSHLKDLLNFYAKFVRKLEYSDRRLTLDLSKTEFINSWAIMEIAHFFLEVGRENGIQLKVICGNKQYTRNLYENLKKLEQQFESECAIAVLVND